MTFIKITFIIVHVFRNVKNVSNSFLLSFPPAKIMIRSNRSSKKDGQIKISPMKFMLLLSNRSVVKIDENKNEFDFRRGIIQTKKK